MIFLFIGLVLFIATHSLRIFAADWRERQIARLGEKPWKGLVSLVSLLSFILLIWGFGQARLDPIIVYQPPFWLKHVTILLTIPAFILLGAANVPANSLKARLGHPMILGVKIWAFAHLLANGAARDILLFGGLLVWSIVSFATARRHDRRNGVTYPAGTPRGNAIVVVGGLASWALFALLLHRWLIGVSPFAM